MKRTVAIVFVLLFADLYAQEVPSRVIEKSPIFKEISGGVVKDDYIDDYIYPGDIVYTRNFGFCALIRKERQRASIISYVKDEEEQCTLTKNLVPLDTEDLFSQDILTKETSFLADDDWILGEMWLPRYYADVLIVQDRELLPKYEPVLVDYDPEAGYEEHYGTSKWYDIMYGSVNNGMTLFFNSIIIIRNDYYFGFLISNISKREYGYEVQCYGPEKERLRAEISPEFNWDIYPGGEVTLYIYIDNEYMDIYMNGVDPEHKFGSLIRVQEEFIRQFQQLIKTGTCDLTNVVWPRRADKQIEAGKPYRTAGILKLRVNEDRNSETIMEMPENTAVVVLETGAEDTIDDIKANWVNVRLEDGTEGWCFGGYLLADIPVESAGTRQTSRGVSGQEGTADQEEDAAAGSQPAAGFPWVVMAIIAGIALVGITAFVVILRKKR
jgi:hypothetical protein